MAQMDLHEIRRRNLKYLGDQIHGRDNLALALGYSDTNYINRVISGHTKLGTRNAEAFGITLRLGENWFNERHESLWLGLNTAESVTELDRVIGSLNGDDLEILLSLARRLAVARADSGKES